MYDGRWMRFGSPSGVYAGSAWGLFEVRLGSIWGPCGDLSSRHPPDVHLTRLGEQFDPPWTDLGAPLKPYVSLMWVPCCPVGGRGRFGTVFGVLGAIRCDLGLEFDQHGAADETKMLDIQNSFKTL